jgi:hypothetical protein
VSYYSGTVAATVTLGVSQKYDGSVNPDEFLHIFITAMRSAGGNEVVMANYFSVALTGLARSWLMNLPHDSIPS